MDRSAYLGRASLGLTVAAIIYSVALLAWVVAIPGIDGQTLLEYGGPASLAITVQPLLVSLLMWTLLRRRCTTGSRLASSAAWAIGGSYLAWSVLAALSLAAGALPASLLLLIAAMLTPTPNSR